MKVLNLKVAGFGPYRSEQFVDFTRFDNDGLFLIAGPTGAGKSSVLDAIMYALYGNTPRYDDTGTGEQIRSNFCGPTDPTRVTVEFEHGGVYYRMSRSLAYQVPKKSGDGMRTVAGKLAFERREGDQWHTIATRAKQVAQEFAEVFPLRADEFLQVVLLAQNAFMKFLDAKTGERQEVLRKLFRTYLYRDLMDAVKSRADAARVNVDETHSALEVAVAEIERLRGSVCAAAEGIAADAAADAAEVAADSASGEETAVDAADAAAASDDAPTADDSAAAPSPEQLVAAALAEIAAAQAWVRDARDHAELVANADAQRAAKAKEQRQLQQLRDQLQQERDALQQQSQHIEDQVVPKIAAAETAAPLLPYLEGEERAGTAVAEAAAELKAARIRLADVDTDTELAIGRQTADTDESGVLSDELVAKHTGELEHAREFLGVLRERADAETELEQLEQRQREANELVDSLAEQLDRVQREAAERPAKLAEQQAKHTEFTGLAALVAARTEAVEQAERVCAAARELPAAETRCEQAAAAYRSALSEREHANQHERELAERRYRNAAIELASQLAPGEACAVCGATDHPNPAHPGDAQQQPVSDTELAAARERSQLAHDRVSAAHDEVQTHERERDALRQKSGGTSLDAATATLTTARAELTAAREADAALQKCSEQIETLKREIEADAQQLRDAEAALVRARSSSDNAAEACQQMRSEVTRLRAGQPTIARRIKIIAALITATDSLLQSNSAVRNTRQQLEAATRQLDERLASSPFADRDRLAAAALPASKVAELREEVHQHREAVAEVRAKLADERFATLPDTPVDSDTPAAVAQASANRLTELNQLAGSVASEQRRAAEQAEHSRELMARLGEEGARAEALSRFADTLRGANARKQNIEVFVLASWLEEIIRAANAHLTELSSGRYQLEVDESIEAHGRQSGLGIAVFDSYNGELRKPQSLSGGETFLVSLALALGLAEVVSAQAGGISLDTLFIDEGFGSLDSETLEVAMRSLDQLRQSGRTIGVISHVEAMHQRIPAKLVVERNPDGSSRLLLE
ncbi:AAA family ATPase [Gulosibacter hominis]|uniref:AAA family ATPase n=1 Tax=Gulosibacter hominis TaxID=2770504 RepID=UPI0019189AA5|nr:SMC family ATPase [Gulosibacter hominis]